MILLFTESVPHDFNNILGLLEARLNQDPESMKIHLFIRKIYLFKLLLLSGYSNVSSLISQWFHRWASAQEGGLRQRQKSEK